MGDVYGYLLVATGRAEVCIDPFLNIWDYGPCPVILHEAGEEGHTRGDALACNVALKPKAVKLLQGF